MPTNPVARSQVRRGAALLIALAVAIAASIATSPAEARRRAKRKLSPGVTYTRIVQRRPPNRIHVVTLKMSARPRLDVALATRRLPGLETTSAMARRRGALVAINGDYARLSGRPVTTFARKGELAQTPLIWGRNFAANIPRGITHIGHPKTKVGFRLMHRPRFRWRIKRVNYGRPNARRFSLVTPSAGRLVRPPRRACSARLRPRGRARLRDSGVGVERVFRVAARRCGRQALALKGGYVLSAPLRGAKAGVIKRLRRGTKLQLFWSLGWKGVNSTIGGNPTLIERGRIVVGNSRDPFFMHNPRTGIGTTRNGRILLVTVDGRLPGYSTGMTLRQFALLFRRLGANWALNLDGGGSTTMVVRGRVLNSPSDGTERPVSSAVLVFPPRRGSGGQGRKNQGRKNQGGKKPKRSPRPIARSATEEAVALSALTLEPSALRTLAIQPVQSGAQVWEAVVADPASTGGLMAAMLGRRPLSASLARYANQFQRAHARGPERVFDTTLAGLGALFGSPD